ncbi:hypothetical protein [Francisella philomiragia]|uniref:hypothetical protein n=1 Tax=Francisella philomiragia TaxID=28110 RepID=UPI0019055D6D|nr:hypothetical protein [Francisella philomiragia]MBK2107068.1 hypothetical protein [Francisella philomiragia]
MISLSNDLDGGTALEYTESLVGTALVACQTYMVGTVGDISEIKGTKLNKIELYKYGKSKCEEYTIVELVNALANFFKHNEEWVSSWPTNETAKTLRSYGIDGNTEFPLCKGIEKIIGESFELNGLVTVLKDWRYSLINDLSEN